MPRLGFPLFHLFHLFDIVNHIIVCHTLSCRFHFLKPSPAKRDEEERQKSSDATQKKCEKTQRHGCNFGVFKVTRLRICCNKQAVAPRLGARVGSEMWCEEKECYSLGRGSCCTLQKWCYGAKSYRSSEAPTSCRYLLKVEVVVSVESGGSPATEAERTVQCLVINPPP